jgi:4-carboxymuconolactone decarboxylase
MWTRLMRTGVHTGRSRDDEHDRPISLVRADPISQVQCRQPRHRSLDVRVGVSVALLAMSCWSVAPAHAQDQPSAQKAPVMSSQDLSSVSPALARYTHDVLLNGLWQRPGLSPRDRSLITLAALIARNQTGELPFYMNYALDHGVQTKEISETITHLAFYAGWANGTSATAVARAIFVERGIGSDQLPAASPQLLPLDQAAEDRRARTVEETVGPASPGLVEDTGAVLFRDLWLRPDLAPRDRSLITVATLIANGQVQQIPYHLGRAMDNGLTQAEASEMISHLAYYAGWPNAFSAVPVVKGVFESRAK